MRTKSLFIMIVVTLVSQFNNKALASDSTSISKREWFKNISVKGYLQLRYNRLAETNPKLKCEQCDKSIGENNSFSIRRARLTVSGDVHERVYVYSQIDVANNLSTTNANFLQLRDMYADIAFDAKKEYRVRFGQSKVPFGFDNLQSSSNRIAFDRSDVVNSAAPNERDLGVSLMWAPTKTRALFKKLATPEYKGSGDYGMLTFSVYNGQSANRLELNNNPHIAARFTYPYEFKGGQIIEAGIQGYQGHFVISKSPKTKGSSTFFERRMGAHFVLYPQPFGIQAEYNIGDGPRFNSADSSVISDKVSGYYIQAMYALKYKGHHFNPYVRYQNYDGGKKHEIDARYYLVKELEMGIEWQPVKFFELTASYMISNRTFQDYDLPINNQKGNMLRLQAQFSF